MIRPEPGDDWRLALDANVLLQAAMRDTILRLAEARMLSVFWSESILAEVERNFPRVSGEGDAARRYAVLFNALRRNFSAALVACAVAAAATIIVTYNTRHFPDRGLNPHGIRAWHPDEFLCALLGQRPADVAAVLVAQGAALHPPRSLAQVVHRLARDAPRFALLARARFDV